MKIVGTIVNENLSLIGCVVSKDKKTKAFSLQDVKSMIKKGEIDNFSLDAKDEFVGNSNKKLSNLKMFTSKGQEIDNRIAIKSIIETENGELLGAEINVAALHKSLKLKINDLVKLYNYCESTNFMLRNRDNKWYITGKGDTKKEDIPVVRPKEKVVAEEKILDAEDLEILNIKNDSNSDIIIPQYVKHSNKVYKIVGIGDYVFTTLECKTLILPESIREISEKAFLKVDDRGNHNILYCSNIEIAKNNPYFITEDGVLYNKEKTILYYYPVMRLESDYIMPNSVERVLQIPFFSSTLKNIKLSSKLEKIPFEMFSGLKRLEHVEFGKNSVCKEIDDYAFANCPGLSSVKLGNNIERIGQSAFEDCKKLSSINLCDSLTEIDVSAFSGCRNLDNIRVPGNCKKINKYVFSGCLFDTIDLAEGIEEICKGAFEGCFDASNLEEIYFDIDSEETFNSYNENIPNLIRENVWGLKSIKIPSTCKIIGEGAFEGCVALESVILPEGVERIEDDAFFGCYSELNYSGYENIDRDYSSYEEFLEDEPYVECLTYKLGLTTLTIPSTCKYIGENAFAGCELLKSVNMENGIKIPVTVEKIGENAFENSNFDVIDLEDNLNNSDVNLNIFSKRGIITTLITGNNPIAVHLLKNCKIKELKYKGSETDFIMSDLYNAVSGDLARLRIEYLNNSDVEVNWSQAGSDEIDFDSFEIEI